jgi:hypothetical protein
LMQLNPFATNCWKRYTKAVPAGFESTGFPTG